MEEKGENGAARASESQVKADLRFRGVGGTGAERGSETGVVLMA
jgi:hypothetical protein